MDYVIQSVVMVATYGWKLLPQARLHNIITLLSFKFPLHQIEVIDDFVYTSAIEIIIIFTHGRD